MCIRDTPQTAAVTWTCFRPNALWRVGRADKEVPIMCRSSNGFTVPKAHGAGRYTAPKARSFRGTGLRCRVPPSAMCLRYGEPVAAAAHDRYFLVSAPDAPERVGAKAGPGNGRSLRG